MKLNMFLLCILYNHFFIRILFKAGVRYKAPYKELSLFGNDLHDVQYLI